MSTPNYSLIQQHHFKSVDNAPGAAERTADRMASNVPTDPNTSSRRLSFTQRLVGSGREWMTGFYGSVEKDDLNAGHGFADGIDDFIPGVLASGQRRRNSSISSEASDDSGSVRRGSITDRVAGLQLNRKPKSPLESYAVGFATVIDDQN